MTGTTSEALRFAYWLQSIGIGVIGEDVDVHRMHEWWERDGEPAALSPEGADPYCNHDQAALMTVDVTVCECGAYFDPDTGREITRDVDPATRDRYAYPDGFDVVTDEHGAAV